MVIVEARSSALTAPSLYGTWKELPSQGRSSRSFGSEIEHESRTEVSGNLGLAYLNLRGLLRELETLKGKDYAV